MYVFRFFVIKNKTRKTIQQLTVLLSGIMLAKIYTINTKSSHFIFADSHVHIVCMFFSCLFVVLVRIKCILFSERDVVMMRCLLIQLLELFNLILFEKFQCETTSFSFHALNAGNPISNI